MMLEGSNASAAIRWVRQDLDEALLAVRDNLEAFAADPSQREPLRTVQEKLEQLNLTFLTMEQHGATVLTDEMIAVGGHMLHNGQGNMRDSLAALTDAVIVLPSYLDRLQAGHEDLPILLLPTLNELRATYDETLLSEGTLFAPGLDVMIPELNGNEADALGTSEFNAFARRIRNQYQAALLGWLKEQSKLAMLDPLRYVCRTLHERLGRHALRRLWWIAEMAIAGFHDGAIDNDLPLRRMFARLDLTLKAMTESGENGPSEEALTALSRALLFHAAQARPGSKSMDLLRRRFRLEELIPDRDALLRARGAVTGRDAELFQSIGAAVREELSLVKDALDMELRTGRVEQEQRASSRASLQQLADTLNMLNLPVAARAVEDLLPDLEQTEGEVNLELDSPLLRLAQKLIEVESVLDTHIRLLGEPVESGESAGFIAMSAPEFRLILNQLLDESVTSLQDVQEAVRQRLDGDGGADFATPLESMVGALKLAGQGEVALLTEKLERCLNAELHSVAVGKDAAGKARRPNLDSLTDAVAALELYLAGCRDQQVNSVRFLQIMHQRLDGLPEASTGGDAVEQTQVARPGMLAAPAPAVTQGTATQEATAGIAPIDPVLQQVFLEEFDAVLRQLQEALPAWLEDVSDAKALADVRRGFHTIKGSGRMVGATEAGDFAWRIEELLNRVVDHKLPADPALTATVKLAVQALPALKARLQQQASIVDGDALARLAEFARQLVRGEQPLLEHLLAELPPDFVAGSSGGAAPPVDSREAMPATEPAPVLAEPSSQRDTTEPELARLMITELGQYIAELEKFIELTGTPAAGPVSEALLRSVHTLAGTLAMSPLGQEVEVARQLERYLHGLQQQGAAAEPEDVPVLAHCIHRFRQRLWVLENGSVATYPQDEPHLLQDIAALQSRGEAHAAPTDTMIADAAVAAGGLEAVDADILAIFLEEAVEVLERCDTLLNAWRDKLSDYKLVQNLQREIHTFKGGARMAALDGLGDLSHAMETLLERIATKRLQPTIAAVQALEEGTDRLTVWVEELVAGRLPLTADALARFEQKTRALSAEVVTTDTALAAIRVAASSPPTGSAGTATAPPEQPPERATGPQAQPGGTAADQLAAAAQAEDEARAAAGTDVDQVTAGPAAGDGALAAAAGPEASGDSTARAATEASKVEKRKRSVPVDRAPSATGRSQPVPQTASAPPPRRELREVPDHPGVEASDESAGQQHIRVAAELMDSLVNYAGEISIYRARIEQQLGAVRFNLKEVEQTVGRLQEQLRKMEIEAEAQMLTRYQHASAKSSTEFDPLELDRFSNMQQLSRALTESVNDLLNLQEMITESVRQSESLLMQQSRVSTDLQEGLMQTRMTPFGSAAPRLRRVVRAAAAETGKHARLVLKMAGSSDQLDRNVLERITAPLEHMLRNAVVHGIETSKERRRLNKPEEGEITVVVEGEATEFVVRVQDDGGGIDLAAVRKRAIERGMIGREETVDDRRLVDFILESGFSTAASVTGLAGRGVGMDVVSSEIRQIGGSMEIESHRGTGTCFTIRIPFSLAVMQTVGVRAGDRPYLVPLNSVSGVSRMPPADYIALRDSPNPVYAFAGEDYPLMELEPLLGEQPIPVQSESISLLMIRSGEYKAAFRVAELQGHQEVVMKPVGPQVSSIPGILGATISGDGQVVIILDMGPVIRRGLAMAADPGRVVVPPQQKEQRKPLVMVVDDSITMRKVTSRVLENHSLEVMTAQDGLDAIENLHERIPDLMLLDIEMPRMDGYELAEHIRSDPRLRHVPIVMITSRAGQKHRKRAREAGADDYMTKPYQETELLAKVGEMLKLDLQPRRAE